MLLTFCVKNVCISFFYKHTFPLVTRYVLYTGYDIFNYYRNRETPESNSKNGRLQAQQNQKNIGHFKFASS